MPLASGMPRRSAPMSTVSAIGRHLLWSAHLAPDIHATCMEALTRPGRLHSANPAWSRLFLAWTSALDEPPHEQFLTAAVACEFMAAGYDLLDDVYDHVGDVTALTRALPAGTTLLLLAQQTMAGLDAPEARRRRACAALARAHRRFCVGQVRDYALRSQPIAAQDDVLVVMRQRSGGLVAAPCQCASLLAGAPWRIVGLAGRFGRALGCAAQLEDDLADCTDDLQTHRKTIPTILAQGHPGASELVEATTWVLMQHFLQEAAGVLRRLPTSVRMDHLWTLLPAAAHAA